VAIVCVRNREEAAVDALTLLKQDHRTVEELFKKFENAGEKAIKTKRKIVDQVVKELSIHAAIEEAILYPALRNELSEEEGVLEALEEHHVVKWTLEELRTMPADHERFDAKMAVLMESVRHHIREEEKELFVRARKELGAERLAQLGELLEKAKKVAPTRPHPRSPDEPPGNVVSTPLAGLLDRGADAIGAFVARTRAKGKAKGETGKTTH
jgi:hemerythrin superfamily protein